MSSSDSRSRSPQAKKKHKKRDRSRDRNRRHRHRSRSRSRDRTPKDRKRRKRSRTHSSSRSPRRSDKDRDWDRSTTRQVVPSNSQLSATSSENNGKGQFRGQSKPEPFPGANVSGNFDPNAMNDRARNSRWNTNKGFPPRMPIMFPPINLNSAQGQSFLATVPPPAFLTGWKSDSNSFGYGDMSSYFPQFSSWMGLPPMNPLIPPPPPAPNLSDNDFTLAPPPPPPEDNPPSTTNGAEVKTSKFDYAAISAAMRAKTRILGRRRLPTLPKHWGTMSMDSYTIIVQVGEGTYGHVYKAKRKDSSADLVALKKVRLENEREGFPITAVREIKLLRRLDHPNIIKLIDVVTESSSQGSKREFNAFFLVFEYVDHDLNGLLESGMVEFTQDQIASLFKQLLLALQHCHSKDLLHRDLKCANILINNKGELKLGDFGLARIYLKNNDRLYTNRVITLWYRPPELLLGEEKYGVAIDIWSAGCILGELFTKKPIFQGHNETQQLEQIAQCCGTPTTEVWADVINLPLYVNMRFRSYYSRTLRTKFSFFPPLALDLFDQLLALDPKKRPSATKALEHSWLRKIDPSRVPPPDLPKNQDCHERWIKLRRSEQQRNRRSTSLNVNNQNHDSAVAI